MAVFMLAGWLLFLPGQKLAWKTVEIREGSWRVWEKEKETYPRKRNPRLQGWEIMSFDNWVGCSPTQWPEHSGLLSKPSLVQVHIWHMLMSVFHIDQISNSHILNNTYSFNTPIWCDILSRWLSGYSWSGCLCRAMIGFVCGYFYHSGEQAGAEMQLSPAPTQQTHSQTHQSVTVQSPPHRFSVLARVTWGPCFLPGAMGEQRTQRVGCLPSQEFTAYET